MSQYGYFWPVKRRAFFAMPAAGDKWLQTAEKRVRKPFFSVSEDENTVGLFVEALSKMRQDDAKVYISKNFVRDFDLDELSDFFQTMCHYKKLIKVDFIKTPKNCITNSILVLNRENALGGIIHLHLVKEPDAFSKWKIYGIEKE